jgi:hypothetical protein
MRGAGFTPMLDVTQASRSSSAWFQESGVTVLAEAKQGLGASYKVRRNAAPSLFHPPRP